MRRLAADSAICLFFAVTITSASAGVVQHNVARGPRECGSFIAAPFAPHAPANLCPPAGSRSYTPRHHGLAYDVLESESEACFVPDEAFQLLDSIVDDVSASAGSGFVGSVEEKLARAQIVSKLVGDTLRAHHFALFIDTVTLSDAMATNNDGTDSFHTFDCDTSSLIYLTVAENLGLPLSMVEITLPSDFGHNYVRWHIDKNTFLDWDTNGRDRCTTPVDAPSFQGKSMTRTEILGYARALRAELWQRRKKFTAALSDLRTATTMYPNSGLAHNNFGWLVATHDFDGRNSVKAEALVHAERAVKLARNANRLDTLACVNALNGNFAAAIKLTNEAIAKGAALGGRLERYKKRQDCTGLD